MNSEELIVNNEEYKCYAFDVGAGPVSAQKNKITKPNANVVGACIARPPKHKYYERGITLIALIITIIIMLILAGVVLNLTIGERGIFGTATNATEEYEKAKIKEEIQLAIMDIQGEEIAKGNELTLETLKDKLSSKLDTMPNINGSNIEGEYKGYDYEINDKFEIAIKGTVTGIQISYTLSNKEYTKDDITLTINATVADGAITQIVAPDGLTKNTDGTYLITKNGKYTFSVTDDKGNTKEKEIIITNIDKIPPSKPILTVFDIKGKRFKVKVEVDDVEENEENAKSGIANYEYYINAQDKHKIAKSEYEFTELNKNTKYIVNVVAYDKAGNPSETVSTEVTTLIADYATLTLKGVVGEEDAENGLASATYDGDFATFQCLSTNDGLYGHEYRYIMIAPECWGKYVTIYCETVNETFYGCYEFDKTYLSGRIEAGYLRNVTGIVPNILCARSILIPEGAYWLGLCGGTSIECPDFNVYEIWCSEENLSGKTAEELQ